MSDLQNWWDSIPKVTRLIFAGTFGVTLLGNWGLISPYYLILNWQAIYKGFEVWRLISPFLFFGKLSFPFLIHLIFLYRYSTALEAIHFEGRRADYVWFIILGVILLLLSSVVYFQVLLAKGLSFYILYYWSRKNPTVQITFFFGIKFQGIYLPWCLMFFNMIQGGFPIGELIGVVIGHVYFFLNDVLPLTGGTQYTKTPQFVQDMIGRDGNEYGQARRRDQIQDQRGHQWGHGGQALGGGN